MRHILGMMVLSGLLALGVGCGGSSDGPGGGGDDGNGDSGSPPSDTDGGAPPGSDVDGGSTDPGPVDDPAGCEGTTLLGLPSNPAADGPWPVGARTEMIGRLRTEVWYPAEIGSEAGASQVQYDIREALPPSAAERIPDAENPLQGCDCYRDLPIDAGHGPYPVIVFVHGTASFRTQSLTMATHWASRGFVVVSADHPGLMLSDSLAMANLLGCGYPPARDRDLAGDVDALLEWVRTSDFLAGRVDGSRVALIGHSAGGSAVAGLAGRDGVQVVVPMASGESVSDALSLHLAGTSDGVVDYSRSVGAYQGSDSPKYLVGIENAGHLSFSSLCSLRNSDGQNILEIAEANDVCGANLAGFLFDCDPSYLPDPVAWDIINYATSAVLEDRLHCADTASKLDVIEAEYPDVSEYRSE